MNSAAVRGAIGAHIFTTAKRSLENPNIERDSQKIFKHERGPWCIGLKNRPTKHLLNTFLVKMSL
jgi:hypothetical protein